MILIARQSSTRWNLIIAFAKLTGARRIPTIVFDICGPERRQALWRPFTEQQPWQQSLPRPGFICTESTRNVSLKYRLSLIEASSFQKYTSAISYLSHHAFTGRESAHIYPHIPYSHRPLLQVNLVRNSSTPYYHLYFLHAILGSHNRDGSSPRHHRNLENSRIFANLRLEIPQRSRYPIPVSDQYNTRTHV